MIRIFRAGESVVGKLYRASDGSTRNETGPAPGRVNIIGIKNMSERLYYIWRPESGWESRPLDLPGGRYIQPREGAPAGGIRLEETLDGLSLIKMPIDEQGITEYLAPELNYYTVRASMPCNDGQGSGCGLWLVDVKVGEQPAHLFVLPSGEAAAARTEPSRTQRGGVLGACAHP